MHEPRRTRTVGTFSILRFYARQERDGIVYQLVPQPGHPGSKLPRFAAEYSYREGELLGGSGHVRVPVAGATARIEYVLSQPGTVAASYTVGGNARIK